MDWRLTLVFFVATALAYSPDLSADPPPKWPDLARLGSKVGGGEKDAAVLIALETYAHIGKVSGAKRNLADWKRWLIDVRGVADGNVFDMTDDKVTPATVRKKAKLAAESVQSGGTVWFVFIGHGVPAKDGTDALLVTYDARQSDEVYKDTVGRKEILDFLAAGRQARTVFVADSCFSGGKDHGGRDIVRGAQPLIALRDAETRKEEVVFSAGKGDQFAGPLPGEARPAFSYLLLGGLMGWADGVVDGKADKKVTVAEANHFARKALMMQDEREQEPEYAPTSQRDTVLASSVVNGLGLLKELMAQRTLEAEGASRIGPARPVDIVCPAGTTGRDGKCVVDSVVCPGGTRLEGGKCVAAVECPAGSQWNNGKCLAVQVESASAPNNAAERTLAMADRARELGNDVEARRLYADACDSRVARACLEVAFLQDQGRGGPLAKYEAVKLVGRHLDAVDAACRRGDLAACVAVGLIASTGVGTSKDEPRAVELLRKACDGGNLRGCNGLGAMYGNGMGVAKDPVRAVDLYRKACDGGDMMGCANLGVMYGNGFGVAKDLVRAVDLYRKACDGGNLRGCNGLGAMYGNGMGVAKDPVRAVDLHRKACDGGDMMGCANLGAMYENGMGVAKDPVRAIELFRRACDGGDMRGCANLGAMYENGSGVAKDPVRAVDLYRKACDGGEMGGCANLGVMYGNGMGVAKDPVRAVDLYREACDGDDMTGCSNLGVMYGNGFGVAKDPVRAVDLYRKACDGGDMMGCANLGAMYENGSGVAKDPVRAVDLYGKACGGGVTQACNRSYAVVGQVVDINIDSDEAVRREELQRKSDEIPKAAKRAGAASNAVVLPPAAAALTDKDKGRYQRLAESRATALGAAARSSNPKAQAALAEARKFLEVPAIPINPAQLVGNWRCNAFQLGGSLGDDVSEFAATVEPTFSCSISRDGQGNLTLKKMTGSMKKLARLAPTGDPDRLLYYGTTIAQDLPQPTYPGGDPYGHEVGILQQLSADRLRIELSEPNHFGSARHEVIKFVRAK